MATNRPTSEFWANKRVFVTGHTGFKGSWLVTWLDLLGSKIYGYALPPETDPNMFEALGLSDYCEQTLDDIRDRACLDQAMAAFEPEIVFHLAAQPLVRRSYREPIETLSTNIMGTAHVLEACKRSSSVKAVVIVTSDKCYENLEQQQAYQEDDRLGGHDIYSTSKACAELVTSGYRDAFFTDGPMVGTARAGNVIGGGDWSADRLIPDAVRAIFAREELKIRHPDAIRPWQHVLDPLCGYLLLAEGLFNKQHPELLGAFNFGPTHESAKTVKEVVTAFFSYWPDGPEWLHFEDPEKFHEARLLSLDFSKAHKLLNWSPALDLSSALELTAKWYKAFEENENDPVFMREMTRASIQEYAG